MKDKIDCFFLTLKLWIACIINGHKQFQIQMLQIKIKEQERRLNEKGFLDLGLVVFMAWGVIIGAIGIHEVTKDKTAEQVCTKEGKIQIGDSLYQCKRVDKLGQKPQVIVKPCPKCPKPKTIEKPCGDDRKIFPICSQSLK